MMDVLLAELVVGQRVLALDELECGALTNAHTAPRFMQIEQLQSSTCARSLVAS